MQQNGREEHHVNRSSVCEDPIIGKHVLIVGSGVFGLATARAILDDAAKVTIVDRGQALGPMPDAASSDISKIIRPDYGTSSLYAPLAHRAIEAWENDPLFSPHYHRSGFLAYSSTPSEIAVNYVNGSAATNPETQLLETSAAIRQASGLGDLAGSFVDGAQTALLNRNAGWAHASGACRAVADDISSRVQYISGLVQKIEDKRVTLQDGRTIAADLVIVCAGAWAASLLPDLEDVVASGQTIAHIQLSDGEASKLSEMPVIIDMSSGWYTFPPIDNILKIAVHSAGYANLQPSLSDPSKRVSTPATKHYGSDTELPVEAAIQLRRQLKNVLPHLADKPFASTRLCWYADTQDAHWLLDWHPTLNVFVASGDSGHAFKMLPVIGELIVQRIRGYHEPRWDWRRRDWQDSEDIRGDLAASRVSVQ